MSAVPGGAEASWWISGVNDNGQIVAVTDRPGHGVMHAITFDGTKTTSLGSLEASTWPIAINNQGQIVA